MIKNWNEPLCIKITVKELFSYTKIYANSFEDDCHKGVLR